MGLNLRDRLVYVPETTTLEEEYDKIVYNINNFERYYYSLNKPRGWGKTRLCKTLFDNIDKNILFISPNFSNRLIYSQHPNKNKYICKITDIDFYRGLNMDLLIIDEYQRNPNYNKIIAMFSHSSIVSTYT